MKECKNIITRCEDTECRDHIVRRCCPDKRVDTDLEIRSVLRMVSGRDDFDFEHIMLM